MSTRQMAARYSGRGGGGAGALAAADIFGLGAKRRLREAQDLTNIDVEAEKAILAEQQKYAKELADLNQKYALELKKNAATVEALKAAGITPFDSKGNVTPELDRLIFQAGPLQTQNLLTGLEAEGSRLKAGKEYLGSPRGQIALKTGLEGTTLRPAFDTAKVGERTLGVGETGQFYNPMDLLSGQPITGRGATPTEFESKMVLDAKGKPTMQTVPARTMIPGGFSTGVLSPALKAQAEALGAPVAGVGKDAATSGGILPTIQSRGVVGGITDTARRLQGELQPYNMLLRNPGGTYKNMLLDLLFGRNPERDAELILNSR